MGSMRRPGVSLGTTHATERPPRVPNTRNTAANWAQLIHFLLPFSTSPCEFPPAGTCWSRSHCSANGATLRVTKALNSSLFSTTRPSVLAQDKGRRRVERLEILDVQIVPPHFHSERFLDERHQLHRKQGI